MQTRRGFLQLAALGVVGRGVAPPSSSNDPSTDFDVRRFGAAGNGRSDDTGAVNAAILAAAAAGGGTVRFPSGTFTCRSIRLRSFVTLLLDPGTVILAAHGGFDLPESNAPWEAYQDFGHNHWHNSLIWGERVHDVAILGGGLIWGRGIARGEVAELGLPASVTAGIADKAIALKRCCNVTLRDFSVLEGGHFGLLATGCENLTIDNVKIDTNRDGMNVDACRNVRVRNCSVNSPTDDGICLKSSFALGEARPTEDVTISGCFVTGGYQVGSMLDGSFKRLTGPQWPTGRIKFGTESNGGFRNITVSDCVFERSRGLAIETVDGGDVEDITIAGITMREAANAPLFLRVGARLRGPAGITVGAMRRVIVSNIVCDAPTNAMPIILCGIPNHAIEDVSISDVYLVQKGGDPARFAATPPPEELRLYPEPSFFEPLPAQALFIRHARNIEVRHLEMESEEPDARPFAWLEDVDGCDFQRLRFPSQTLAAFSLRDVRSFQVADSVPIADTRLALAENRVVGLAADRPPQHTEAMTSLRLAP